MKIDDKVNGFVELLKGFREGRNSASNLYRYHGMVYNELNGDIETYKREVMNACVNEGLIGSVNEENIGQAINSIFDWLNTGYKALVSKEMGNFGVLKRKDETAKITRVFSTDLTPEEGYKRGQDTAILQNKINRTRGLAEGFLPDENGIKGEREKANLNTFVDTEQVLNYLDSYEGVREELAQRMQKSKVAKFELPNRSKMASFEDKLAEKSKPGPLTAIFLE